MSKQLKKVLAGIAALGALALGGSAIAGAASTHSTTTNPSQNPPRSFSGPAPGTAAHESAEKAVTGAAAAKAQAAAVKAVGGGTAGAVTTNLPGTGYETTVTKANGTKVEVHLDSSFKVMQGPRGGHGGPGWPGGPPPAGYGQPSAPSGSYSG